MTWLESIPVQINTSQHVSATAPSAPAAAESFEELAPRVIQQLRASLSELIEASSANGPIRKAADLERELKLPTTLAWKVFTTAQSDQKLIKVENIPGSGAMNRFFEAAGKKGVPVKLLTAAREAFDNFETLVRDHAGTRAALDSMISGLKNEGSDQIDLHHKRAAFKAYSHIWGVQAQTQLSCFILKPSETNPTSIDAIGLRGLHNLWLLRRNISWVISTSRVCDDDGELRRPVNMRPIDEIDPQTPVSVLKDFCSQPLPHFQNVPIQDGMINTVVEPNSIGSKSALTCLLGDALFEVNARFCNEHNRVHATHSFVRTPVEVLVHDVLVAPGTFRNTEPRVAVYGDQRSNAPGPSRESDRLALRETIVELGRGPSVLRTPDLPRYPDMVRYALEKTGWNADDYTAYRCRVEYPVMPSSVAVEFDLLEQPEN